MAVIATISQSTAPRERRRSRRHRLCLDVEISAGEQASPATILELSQSGFLMETAAPIAVGQLLQLCLLETDEVSARVVWSCGRHFGCEFPRSLAVAPISAAMLKARPANATEEPPRGIRFDASSSVAKPGHLTFARRAWLIIGLSLALWAAAVVVVYANL